MFNYIQKKLYISIFHLLTIRNIFFLFLSISSHLKHISISTCKSPKKVHTVFILKVENSLESGQIGIYILLQYLEWVRQTRHKYLVILYPFILLLIYIRTRYQFLTAKAEKYSGNTLDKLKRLHFKKPVLKFFFLKLKIQT